MKGVDIFCKSQAATSICLSMEQNSTSSPSSATLLGGGAVIDRHNPIIKDSRRNPKATASNLSGATSKKKKSSAAPSDENENDQPKQTGTANPKLNEAAIARRSWSCTKPGEFLSPPGSTRYLLREKAQYSALALSVEDVKMEEPAPSEYSTEQVVVLRVSLHCRGCEKKLRKHLSKMEGVTSFNIDFAAKKVTVAGNVTPADVVSSISKVKNAQLWSPSFSTSEIKNLDSQTVSQTKSAA